MQAAIHVPESAAVLQVVGAMRAASVPICYTPQRSAPTVASEAHGRAPLRDAPRFLGAGEAPNVFISSRARAG